jgi:hypothetical protein
MWPSGKRYTLLSMKSRLTLMSFFTATIHGERIRAKTAKAGLLWIHSPMDLNFAELIFMIERRAISKRLKQLNRKAGCTRF